MKKTEYQLLINRGEIDKKPVLASFGSNHRIELHIKNTGILISTVTSAVKNPDNILYGRDALFTDALKKALLLYVIRYNRFLSVKTADVIVNGKQCASYSLKENGLPLVYSLSEGRLRMPFTKIWNTEDAKEAIAGKSKSSYDGRFTALHALLAAKSDRYEIERFTYYWMAMNGLYNFIASEGEELFKKLEMNEELGKEYRKQGFMIRCYGHEPFRPSGKKDPEIELHGKRIVWYTLPVIRSIPEDSIEGFCKACLVSDNTNEYVQRIHAAIDRMNEKYGYDEQQYPIFPLMVIWLPYKLRCGSFHGENAIPTFCYGDDSLVKELIVINMLLDMFLTEQLPLWLDSGETAGKEQQKYLMRAVLSPEYKKK